MEEKLIELISETLGTCQKKIKPESRFIEDLRADSLDIMELIINAEDAFDIEIDNGYAEKVRTVKDAVDLIKKLTGDK